METEKEIIRDIWVFLKNHNHPPAVGTDACEGFWLDAVREIHEIVDVKWRQHPLALQLGMAMYAYLEKKETRQ